MAVFWVTLLAGLLGDIQLAALVKLTALARTHVFNIGTLLQWPYIALQVPMTNDDEFSSRRIGHQVELAVCSCLLMPGVRRAATFLGLGEKLDRPVAVSRVVRQRRI